MQLKKKRFRDTPAFGNTMALIGIAGIISVLAVFVPRAEAEVVTPEDVKASALKAEAKKIGCRPIYSVAETFMQSRQDGDSLMSLLDSVKEMPSLEPLVNDAFRTTRFEIKENQDRAVKEFAEKKYNECQDDLARLTK